MHREAGQGNVLSATRATPTKSMHLTAYVATAQYTAGDGVVAAKPDRNSNPLNPALGTRK